VPEQPHKTLMDRDQPPKVMAERYGAQLHLLTQMTNYASNLIPRAFQTSEKKLRDMIVCFTFLKQIAAMLDAIDVLARAGAITAAFVPARVAFEAALYLEWMLVADGEKKASYYYVANVRAERLWGKRVITGSPEASAFIEDMKQLGVDLYSNRSELETEALKLVAEADAILAQPELSAANADFEKYVAARTKKGKKPPYEPEWYKVLGKTSVRSIASELRRLPDYIVYYGKGSRVAHSSSTKDHLRFVAKGGAVGHPIRNLAGTHDLLNFVFSNAMIVFMRVLAFYRPDELSRFGAQYVQEWRAAFTQIPRIKIDSVPAPKP
jgi:hypothetical protein